MCAPRRPTTQNKTQRKNQEKSDKFLANEQSKFFDLFQMKTEKEKKINGRCGKPKARIRIIYTSSKQMMLFH